MFRKISLVAALALLLIFGAGLIVAEDEDSAEEPVPPKAIAEMYYSAPRCEQLGCQFTYAEVEWSEPARKPDRYRISWTSTPRWRSIRRPNTRRAGNAIVTDNSYTIDSVRIPWVHGLYVRIRAIYNGERNGPWNCCLELGYGDSNFDVGRRAWLSSD